MPRLLSPIRIRALFRRYRPKFMRFHLFVTLPAILILLLLAGAACQCTFLWSYGSTRCYFGWDNDEIVLGDYRITGFTLPAVPLQFYPETARIYEDTPPDARYSSTFNFFYRFGQSSMAPRSAEMLFVTVWKLVALLIMPGALFLLRIKWLHYRWDSRSASFQCTTCGYDLRGTPDQCPECSTPSCTERPAYMPSFISSTALILLLPLVVISTFVLIAFYKDRSQAADTAFFEAIDQADFAKATALLDRVSSPNIEDRREFHFSHTAMETAIEQKQHELLRQLLLRHALTEHNMGMPWFYWAIQAGDPESVKMFLDEGESPDKPVSKFGTALHIAVDAERPEMVELLLSRGASTTIEDNEGHTPLHLAQIELNDSNRPPLTPETKEKISTIIRLLKAHDASTRPQ